MLPTGSTAIALTVTELVMLSCAGTTALLAVGLAPFIVKCTTASSSGLVMLTAWLVR